MYIILGYGKTGQAVAKFFLQNKIQFLMNDSKTNILHEDGLSGRILESPPYSAVGIKAIICSPGISTQYSPTNDFVIFAKNNHIPIISDIQLFYEFFPNKKYIAITGTNGKSTTTTLTYEILKNAGLNAALCGNIGISPFENGNFPSLNTKSPRAAIHTRHTSYTDAKIIFGRGHWISFRLRVEMTTLTKISTN